MSPKLGQVSQPDQQNREDGDGKHSPFRVKESGQQNGGKYG